NRLAFILAFTDDRLTVHMAGNDVPAELVTHLERALQVDLRALFPASRRGKTERLLPGLDLEPALIGGSLGQGDHGKADTGACNGSADVNRGRIVIRSDP